MKSQIYTRDENGELKLINEIDIPDQPLKPNWLKLEQTLAYTVLFAKAISTANPNMFTVLNTTLQNGKRGEASENFLKYTLQNLGVNWTTEELAELNTYLTDNFFTITIE